MPTDYHANFCARTRLGALRSSLRTTSKSSVSVQCVLAQIRMNAAQISLPCFRLRDPHAKICPANSYIALNFQARSIRILAFAFVRVSIRSRFHPSAFPFVHVGAVRVSIRSR